MSLEGILALLGSAIATAGEDGIVKAWQTTVAVGVSDDGDSTEQSNQILQGYNHINLPVQIGSISINMPARFWQQIIIIY